MQRTITSILTMPATQPLTLETPLRAAVRLTMLVILSSLAACDRAWAGSPATWNSESEFGTQLLAQQPFDGQEPAPRFPFENPDSGGGQQLQSQPALPLTELSNAPADPFAGALQAAPSDGWSETQGAYPAVACEPWRDQVLPSGLLYYSYLAGEKESRFALQNLYANGHGMYWEVALGGRVGLYRWGTLSAANPEGWQIDMEGAALPRLDLLNAMDIQAIDYRFGVPLTWRSGQWSTKFGYYHISSHLGDEFMLKNPTVERLNYYRESLIAGLSYDVTPAWRVYGEVGLALMLSGGAEPLEFQFGTEYSPRAVSAPFAAVNVHLREEFNFGGNVNALVGWQFRGQESGHRFRIGLQYYDGASMQYSFFDKHETLCGAGLWFDY